MSIILHFRQHSFVFLADFEKMYIEKIYRQVVVVLLLKDPYQPPKSYSLNTITYGTAAAGFIFSELT